MRFGKGRSLAVLVPIIMLLSVPSLALMNADAHNLGNDTSPPTSELTFTPDSTMKDIILGMTNTSIYGRPLFVNETTGDLYYSISPEHLGLGVLYRSNGTTQVLNASVGYTPYSQWIFDGVICNDGSILLSIRYENTVIRSTDGGRTFAEVLETRLGQIWRLATRGDAVYACEYSGATGDGADLWLSTDNGKSGTWSVVYQTPQNPASANHWHVVYVDPFTDYVYAASGDYNNSLARSTDGTNFSYWGAFNRYTSIFATEHNIYFGDDTPCRVVVYNKTTEDWSEQDLWAAYAQGPIYNLQAGQHGVLYGRSMAETYSDTRVGAVWLSGDEGMTWSMVVNLTGTQSATTGDQQWSGQEVLSDGFGRVYFGYRMPTADTSSRGVEYIYWMNDLTKEEARSLDGSNDSEMTGESMTYTPANDGFDGQEGYIDLGRNILTGCYLNVVGSRVDNLAHNGTQSGGDWDLNHTWPTNHGWAEGAEAGEEDNITMSVSTRAYSSPYSTKIMGHNTSGNHGIVRYNWELPTAKRPASGTEITFSVRYAVVMDSLQPNTTWPVSMFRGEWVVYYDDLSSDSVYVVGIGASWQGQQCVASTGNFSTTDGWTRAWCSWTVDEGKSLRFVCFDVEVYGIIDIYIDDIMLYNGTHLVPSMEGNEYVNETSEDVNFTLDGTTYQVGTLEDGENISIPLTGKVLSGLVPFNISANGSRHFTWNITGNRQINSWNALVDNVDGVGVASEIYGTSRSVEFYNDGYPIDPVSFSVEGSRSSQTFKANPASSQSVNVSFSYWNPVVVEGQLVAAWSMSSETEGTVEIAITGMNYNQKYMLRVDGAVGSQYRADSAGNLNFSYSGPWSSHVFSLYVYFDGGTEGEDLIADFRYEIAGGRVKFYDESLSGYNLKTWAWDFGDGSASTAQDPTHTYHEAGSYFVRLTVVDVQGQTDTIVKLIAVGESEQPFALDLTQMIIAFGLIAAGFLVVVISRRPSGAIVGIITIFLAIWILLWS